MEPAFSARWRGTFGCVDPARTAREVAFLASVLPLPAFRRVLDVPCGTGRHAAALGRRGYAVVGVDLDEGIVAEARAAGVGAHVGDMRSLDALPTDFDAVVCLWASFGYFDTRTNERVLEGFAARLRPGGRLVLDLPNPDFFEPRQGDREPRPGVVERSRVSDGRRHVELDYGDGVQDRFSWQLFRPAALDRLARPLGLRRIGAATGFDPAAPPSPDAPSVQLLYEGTG